MKAGGIPLCALAAVAAAAAAAAAPSSMRGVRLLTIVESEPGLEARFAELEALRGRVYDLGMEKEDFERQASGTPGLCSHIAGEIMTIHDFSFILIVFHGKSMKIHGFS